MMSFNKMNRDGYCISVCGRYAVWKTHNGTWAAAKWPIPEKNGVPQWLGDSFDSEECRWACDDDLHRYPCGCVLTVRPDWWVHCPKCGSLLPKFQPRALPEPKPKRPKKEPNRPEWLKAATRGYEHGADWDCVHDGRKWALVRVPGYTGWVSLGQTAYHPTSYQVMRRSENRGMHISLAETKGMTSLLDVPRFMKKPHTFSAFDVHEGRATKKDLARFKVMVDELDREDL